MRNFDTIVVSVEYTGKGILGMTTLTEDAYCFLDHGNDPEDLKKAVKKLLAYSFRKEAKMQIELYTSGDFGKRSRLMFSKIEWDNFTTETVSVVACDEWGRFEWGNLKEYGKAAYLKTINAMIDDLANEYTKSKAV